MPPRKSTTKGRVSERSTQATSSKITLDMIPAPDITDSITPDYVVQPRPRVMLEEADKDKMIHEVGQYL